MSDWIVKTDHGRHVVNGQVPQQDKEEVGFVLRLGEKQLLSPVDR